MPGVRFKVKAWLDVARSIFDKAEGFGHFGCLGPFCSKLSQLFQEEIAAQYDGSATADVRL